MIEPQVLFTPKQANNRLTNVLQKCSHVDFIWFEGTQIYSIAKMNIASEITNGP